MESLLLISSRVQANNFVWGWRSTAVHTLACEIRTHIHPRTGEALRVSAHEPRGGLSLITWTSNVPDASPSITFANSVQWRHISNGKMVVVVLPHLIEPTRSASRSGTAIPAWFSMCAATDSVRCVVPASQASGSAAALPWTWSGRMSPPCIPPIDVPMHATARARAAPLYQPRNDSTLYLFKADRSGSADRKRRTREIYGRGL